MGFIKCPYRLVYGGCDSASAHSLNGLSEYALIGTDKEEGYVGAYCISDGTKGVLSGTYYHFTSASKHNTFNEYAYGYAKGLITGASSDVLDACKTGMTTLKENYGNKWLVSVGLPKFTLSVGGSVAYDTGLVFNGRPVYTVGTKKLYFADEWVYGDIPIGTYPVENYTVDDEGIRHYYGHPYYTIVNSYNTTAFDGLAPLGYGACYLMPRGSLREDDNGDIPSDISKYIAMTRRINDGSASMDGRIVWCGKKRFGVYDAAYAGNAPSTHFTIGNGRFKFTSDNTSAFKNFYAVQSSSRTDDRYTYVGCYFEPTVLKYVIGSFGVGLWWEGDEPSFFEDVVFTPRTDGEYDGETCTYTCTFESASFVEDSRYETSTGTVLLTDIPRMIETWEK